VDSTSEEVLEVLKMDPDRAKVKDFGAKVAALWNADDGVVVAEGVLDLFGVVFLGDPGGSGDLAWQEQYFRKLAARMSLWAEAYDEAVEDALRLEAAQDGAGVSRVKGTTPLLGATETSWAAERRNELLSTCIEEATRRWHIIDGIVGDRERRYGARITELADETKKLRTKPANV
jgi:hypothetical protein